MRHERQQSPIRILTSMSRSRRPRSQAHDNVYCRTHFLRCLFEQRLPFSNRVKHLKHTIHHHVTFVLWIENSSDYIHCFTMHLLTSSNGSLVLVNSHKNPAFEHSHVVAARQLIRIYSPIHMMAPGDNPGPTRYVFRVSFENVVGPIAMAIPECPHGVSGTHAA